MQQLPDNYQEVPASPGGNINSTQLIRRFLRALLPNWYIIAICLIVAGAVAAFMIYTRVPVYTSAARMWIRGKIQVSNVGQYTEDSQSFSGTQIALIQSPKMQERALARLKTTNPNITLPKNAEGQIEVPTVRVNLTPRSSLYVLECTSLNPPLAQAYLDAIMDEFLAYKKEIRSSTSGDALLSVSEQLNKAERDLKGEQEKIALFQKENNVALLQEQLSGGGGHLAQLQGQLSMLKLELQLLDAVALEKESGSAKTNFTDVSFDPTRALGLTSTQSTPPTDAISARQQVTVLKVQRDQLSRYLRPKHPKIIKLDEEIAKTEKVLESYKKQNEQQIATSKEALKIRIASVESTTKELGEKVGNANRKLAELDSLKANVARYQRLYDHLHTLLQGVDITSSMDQESFTILDRATPAMISVNTTLKIAGIALGGGLVLALGIIFIRVYFDDRCEDLVEVRGRFAEEVFGQIPEVHAKSKKDKALNPILELEDRRHIFAESCRNLRSNLLYGMMEGTRPRVILVTSAAPDEGKSTVAINMARALALGGARVLLIDADLRRGHIHKTMGLNGEIGLAQCIQQGGNLDAFVQTTSLPTLFVLPKGRLAFNTGELFLTPAFEAMVQQARQQYEFVIIDSIPVFAADDTTTLAPKTDGVLFVIRRGFTSTRMAQEALELLYQRNVKILGIVFNRADTRAASYRYYKYDKYSSEQIKDEVVG